MIILALSTIPSCRQSLSKTAKFLSKQMNTSINLYSMRNYTVRFIKLFLQLASEV